MAEITTADVEVIRDGWSRRTAASKGGRVGVDRALKRLRHLFNWAIENGHVEHTPFKRHGVAVVHFKRDEGRTRPLEPGEEEQLLRHSPPLLHALITAALETGCRRGELLRLRWRDVKSENGVLLLPREITKTGVARDVPITQRLRLFLNCGGTHRMERSTRVTHSSSAMRLASASGTCAIYGNGRATKPGSPV